jgi:translation initiation factor IF-2
LARGKGKRQNAPAAATAASSDYTPTAIAVVTAPREYQNPFAPVETPAAVTAEPAAAVAPMAVAHVPEQASTAPVHPEAAPEVTAKAPAPVESQETDEHAELNILPPEQPRNTPAQTWESEGFRPAREPRGDRPRRDGSRRDEPRREESTESVPFDPASIPEKFLYVRPGYNYVPTPSNYGGAPRENREHRESRSSAPVSSSASAPAKSSGGFFGWLKSLFGGSAPAPAAAPAGEHRSGDRSHGDRHRGGRGRGQGGGGSGGGDGQRRRSRGGRGRSSQRGEYRGGGDQGGPSAT